MLGDRSSRQICNTLSATSNVPRRAADLFITFLDSPHNHLLHLEECFNANSDFHFLNWKIEETSYLGLTPGLTAGVKSCILKLHPGVGPNHTVSKQGGDFPSSNSLKTMWVTHWMSFSWFSTETELQNSLWFTVEIKDCRTVGCLKGQWLMPWGCLTTKPITHTKPAFLPRAPALLSLGSDLLEPSFTTSHRGGKVMWLPIPFAQVSR